MLLVILSVDLSGALTTLIGCKLFYNIQLLFVLFAKGLKGGRRTPFEVQNYLNFRETLVFVSKRLFQIKRFRK